MKLVILVTLALSVCAQAGHAGNTTLVGDAALGRWVLSLTDGQPAPYRATLDLREPGQVSGQAPCNRYFATLAPGEGDFVLGAIGTTRMACPQMAAEVDYLQALQGVATAVAAPDRLMLTGNGRELVFVPVPD